MTAEGKAEGKLKGKLKKQRASRAAGGWTPG
jgi:hypothetical protein